MCSSSTDASGEFTTEATIKLWVGDERIIATGEGNGPVNALDTALREAIGDRFPELAHVHLTDYKVRVLDTAEGHRRGDPRAPRLDRRRPLVVDDRREREHHRGVAGRPWSTRLPSAS